MEATAGRAAVALLEVSGSSGMGGGEGGGESGGSKGGGEVIASLSWGLGCSGNRGGRCGDEGGGRSGMRGRALLHKQQ